MVAPYGKRAASKFDTIRGRLRKITENNQNGGDKSHKGAHITEKASESLITSKVVSTVHNSPPLLRYFFPQIHSGALPLMTQSLSVYASMRAALSASRFDHS